MLACLLWEDTFYEAGQQIVERIGRLALEVRSEDLAALAIDAREQMKLRHAPLWLCRALARARSPLLAATLVGSAWFRCAPHRFGCTPGRPDPHLARMRAYEKLDAFRLCHELALRTYRVAEQLDERDPDLAAQLWSAALMASGRIARGAGFANRRMFALCLDRTLGALAELGYHLKIARALELMTDETERELESLRGRAVFYTRKLLGELLGDPGAAG